MRLSEAERQEASRQGDPTCPHDPRAQPISHPQEGSLSDRTVWSHGGQRRLSFSWPLTNAPSFRGGQICGAHSFTIIHSFIHSCIIHPFVRAFTHSFVWHLLSTTAVLSSTRDGSMNRAWSSPTYNTQSQGGRWSRSVKCSWCYEECL